MTDQYSEDMEVLKEKTGYYDKNPHERKARTMSIKTEIDEIILSNAALNEPIAKMTGRLIAQLFASELEKSINSGSKDYQISEFEAVNNIQALIDSLRDKENEKTYSLPNPTKAELDKMSITIDKNISMRELRSPSDSLKGNDV